MGDQIYEILGKHFMGNELLPHEEQLLADWKKQSGNSEVYGQIENVWKVTGRVKFPEEPNLDDEWNKFSELKNQQTPVKQINFKRLIWSAASIIVLLGIFISYFTFSDNQIQVESNNLQKEIKLPDGSTVVLNKNTTLSYNKKFGVKNRSLKMEGEAFYNVVHNKQLPFIIETNGGVQTKVLGTSFNLRAFKNESKAKLVVVSGKVLFGLISDGKQEVFEKDAQAELNIKTGELIKVKKLNTNLLAWRTNKLKFNSTPLKSVIETCEEYFNIKIIIPKEFETQKFSGKFNKPTVNEFADLVAATFNFEYKITDEKVVFQKNQD